MGIYLLVTMIPLPHPEEVGPAVLKKTLLTITAIGKNGQQWNGRAKESPVPF